MVHCNSPELQLQLTVESEIKFWQQGSHSIVHETTKRKKHNRLIYSKVTMQLLINDLCISESEMACMIWIFPTWENSSYARLLESLQCLCIDVFVCFLSKRKMIIKGFSSFCGDNESCVVAVVCVDLWATQPWHCESMRKANWRHLYPFGTP
jgi:hypothetical protein